MGSRGNPVIQSLVFSLATGPAEISRPMSAKRLVVAEPKPFRLFLGAFFRSAVSGYKGELSGLIPWSLTGSWILCNKIGFSSYNVFRCPLLGFLISSIEMRTFFVTLAAVCLSSLILADEEAPKQEAKTPLMVSFTDLKWTELPERKGMQFAVLSGDPKKGEYTQMRKVPAGTDNPLHSHSSELKNVIISGVWYTGPDAASAGNFGPGSIVLMPANWVHVSGCRSGSDCVFYQEGKGKFDFKPSAEVPTGR
jgi:ChrR Cupin-like domain